MTNATLVALLGGMLSLGFRHFAVGYLCQVVEENLERTEIAEFFGMSKDILPDLLKEICRIEQRAQLARPIQAMTDDKKDCLVISADQISSGLFIALRHAFHQGSKTVRIVGHGNLLRGESGLAKTVAMKALERATKKWSEKNFMLWRTVRQQDRTFFQVEMTDGERVTPGATLGGAAKKIGKVKKLVGF